MGGGHADLWFVMASQLAFMMIGNISAVPRSSITVLSALRLIPRRQPMRSIAETVESRVNKVYQVYERTL
jgi:hypothetical protein